MDLLLRRRINSWSRRCGHHHRRHVASPGIPTHDAAGAADTHAGANQREVGREEEAADDPPRVAPVDWRVCADRRHQFSWKTPQPLGGRRHRLEVPGGETRMMATMGDT